MKAFSSWILMITLMMAAIGCSTNEILEYRPGEGNPDVIKYAVGEVVTRAASEVTAASFDEFGVLVKQTTTGNLVHPFITEYERIWRNNASGWRYANFETNPRFWPTTPLNFYAHAPIQSGGVNGIFAEANAGSTNDPMVRVIVRSDVSDQIDFLLARAALAQSKQTTAATNGTLTLNFHHALTKITFSFQKTGSSFTLPATDSLKVDSVVITDLYAEGKHVLAFTGHDFWDTSGTTATTSYRVSVDENTLLGDTVPTHVDDTTPYSLKSIMPRGSMMLIPQTISNTSMLRIYFRTYKFGIGNPRMFEYPHNVIMQTWASGMWYNYRIPLSEDGQPVDVEARPWDDGGIPAQLVERKLEVSHIDRRVSNGSVARVYFTSNQPRVWVARQGYTAANSSDHTLGAAIADLNTLYRDSLAWSTATPYTAYNGATNSTNRRTFHYTYANGQGSGYFDIEATANNAVTNNRHILMLCAADSTSLATPLRRSVKVNNIVTHPAPPVGADTKYVGTFHRHNQVGERVVNFAHNSAWVAVVEPFDAQNAAGASFADYQEVLIDRNTSPDPDLYTATPNEAENYAVAPWDNSLGGTLTGNRRWVRGSTGRIHLRIGWRTPAPTTRPRYALVRIYVDNTPNAAAPTPDAVVTTLYLRQGEEADYLMRPIDAYGNAPVGVSGPNWRPEAQRFSPYNLTDPNMGTGGPDISDHNQLAVKGGDFVKYPSQAGAFFQWAANAPDERRAFHPTNPNTGAITGWSDIFSAGFWNTLSANNETCPPGYRRPNDGATNAATAEAVAGSEMRQSLYLNANAGQGVGTTVNNVWGYYADGFFDRRVIQDGLGLTNGTDAAVSNNTKGVAYWGRVYFNMINNASIFFPAAGHTYFNDGRLSGAGLYGLYWSSSAGLDAHAGWYSGFHSNSAYQSFDHRNNGFSIRCIKEMPVGGINPPGNGNYVPW